MKEIKCTLKIYRGNKLVNLFEWHDAEQVKGRFISVCLDKLVNKNYVRFHKVPYQDKIEITQKWRPDITDAVYKWVFIGLCDWY